MISTPTKHSDKSPQELFSSLNVLPKIKHFHTFTCPTYILDNALQGQHYLPKWKFILQGRLSNSIAFAASADPTYHVLSPSHDRTRS